MEAIPPAGAGMEVVVERQPHETFFSRPDRVLTTRHLCPERADLFVFTTYFNSQRFRSRLKLFEDFAKRVKQAGARLYVAEIAFGHRRFVLDAIPEIDHLLRLESTDELWLKENALNLLIQDAPLTWQYGCWLDADTRFAADDWANSTVQLLQHYDWLQMWSEAIDLGPQNEVLTRYYGFVWSWRNHIPPPDGYYVRPGVGPHYYHPGFGWAFTKPGFETVGGLIDWTILGGGDLYMARALTGVEANKLPRALGPTGRRLIKIWRERAAKHIDYNVGYLPGTILHFFHGAKVKRRYKDRGQILVRAGFDPEKDLKRNFQGLYQLEPGNAALRDGLREYLGARDEDATSV